ncbi:GNAT family N-acetyltransferase [Planococcus dechangensis]|uniref:GNAT family N-acetyltransferase n=1 Tax=Planococcus dechangensis TaxID=1176255 RepID=A0ABV9M8A5_9BACL
MEIVTERLIITPCTNEWVPKLKKQGYDNGPEIRNHLTALAKDQSLAHWGSWLVIRKSDDAIVGDIGFKGKPNAMKQVEVGYGMMEQYRHRGYATEAVAALIDWAITLKEVNTVIAETETENAGSIRVMVKVKMKKTIETQSMMLWERSKEI